MRKVIFILIFCPAIAFGQQFDCSFFNITNINVDNINQTIDISIYNGDTVFVSYPFVAYTLNFLGDTIQKGNINLFGALPLDTSFYSYQLLNPASLLYPLSVYFVFDLPFSNGGDTCVLSYHPSCDSVLISFDSLNTISSPNLLSINVQTLGLNNFGFGYGGFVLLDEIGDTVGQENITTAGNVFGLMSYNTENRIIELSQNITTSFNGYLHLVTGLFAGNPSISCVFPFNINNGTVNIEQINKRKSFLKVFDILGKEIKHKVNRPLFYIYDDGTVEKRIIID